MSIYDKASKLKCAVEDLFAAVFKLSKSDKVAFRVGNESDDPLNVTIDGTMADTPVVRIIEAEDKNTKYDFTFTEGTKTLLIRSEKVAQIKYNFNEVSFDDGVKLTITSGGYLMLSGLTLKAGLQFFFECDKDNVDLEILEWT